MWYNFFMFEKEEDNIIQKKAEPEKSAFTRDSAAFELLAPAGDAESFYAAVNSGADAVYLGLSDFNARRKAENFTTENIRDYIKYAHFFGVKVYVALNTLVFNDEFENFIELARAAVEAKADAFIVQDLGVARVLKKCFPNMPLHASTQAGIHNAEGAKIAEILGFSRVVLSRETKLEDIKEIKRQTNLETEFFVQGALCVCFSGNCYLSARECGASGNRGLCRQLCRLSYEAEMNGKKYEGYFLSARDLCLFTALSDLAAAGVTSFKIEGRMRRAGYVAQATALYAEALERLKARNDNSDTRNTIGALNGNSYPRNDLCARNDSSVARMRNGNFVARSVDAAKKNDCRAGNKADAIYRSSQKDELNEFFESAQAQMLKAFNRGGFLKRAYLDDEKQKYIIGKKFNNHTGVKIGEVESVKPFKERLFEITIKAGQEIHDGDGLKFFENDIEKASAGVGGIKKIKSGLYSFVSSAYVKKGWNVNLISDKEAEEKALSVKKLLGIKIDVLAEAGLPLEIEMSYERGGENIKTVQRGEVCERAKNAPIDEKSIKQQIEKLSEFSFKPIKTVVKTNGVFIAKSTLNALRRLAAKSLKEAITENFEKSNKTCIDEKQINLCIDFIKSKLQNEAFNNTKQPDKHSVITNTQKNRAFTVYSDNFADGGERWRQADIVIIDLAKFSKAEFDKTYDKLRLSKGQKTALNMPIVANGKDMKVLKSLIAEIRDKIDFLAANNLYAIELAKEFGLSFIAGYGLNAANSFTVQTLKESGAEFYAETFEFNQEIKTKEAATEVRETLSIDNKNFKLPLMTLAHCPVKTLTDCDCPTCKYCGEISLKRGDKSYVLRRITISECYFQLYKNECI